jgi:hypothetical protein
MSKDRIEGRDIANEQWMAWKGYEVDPDVQAAGGVATICVYEGNAARTGELDQTSAARLGAFLLEAAGVDIVSAARRVSAGHAARIAALVCEPTDGEAYQAAINARDGALEDLAAELAKLDEP